MDIQWYPGHMTKARRQMQEELKIIDLIIELVDARVPMSSRNPDLQAMGQGKARMIILNKADMADEAKNKAWVNYYKEQGICAMLADSRNKSLVKQAQPLIREACKERIERNIRRGFKNRPIRAMIVGIPNVGKSTFINTFAGKTSAKTGNKPGVTKGKQWIHLSKDLDLLDTPGILWPKFEDPLVGKKLAMIGSIKDEILVNEEISLDLIGFMRESYPDYLADKYEISLEGSNLEILQKIAEQRNCLVKGGVFSTEKAADILLDNFRSTKLGRITLEMPEDFEGR